MCKIKCFFIFFLFLPFVLFGQVLNYLSPGYNTKETIDDGRIFLNRYLINISSYSNIWIYYSMGKEPIALLFENVRKNNDIELIPFNLDKPLHLGSLIYHKVEESYSTEEDFIEIWKVVNNKLTSVEWIWSDGRRIKDKRIIYNSNGLNVNFDSFLIKLYNIPEAELIDIFLKEYVKDIFELLLDNKNLNRIKNDYNSNRYNEILSGNYNDILRLLPFLKKQELAIIRNCIYAKYRFSFQTPYWRDFFQKYYISNYNGTNNNAKVIEQLSDNEKWLLELIIEYEKRFN
jgi:hypothetical protein